MQLVKTLLKISWRNLFRNPRRTFLTLFTLTIGGAGLLLVEGFLNGILHEFAEVFIHSQSGHLQIHRQGYAKRNAGAPLDYMISESKKLAAALERMPHVLLTVPRVKFTGMAMTEEQGLGAVILGVDPEKENRMANYKTEKTGNVSTKILEGNELDPAATKQAVVGKGLHENLGVGIGKKIVLMTTQKNGAVEGAELDLVGTFETYVKEFDDRAMKIPLSLAQDMLKVQDQVSSILVVLDDTNHTEMARVQLETWIKQNSFPLEVTTWLENSLYYRQTRDLFLKISSVLQLMVVVVLGFSIANTVNMNLLERNREFGCMMALGNGRGLIAVQIVLETVFMAVLGCLAALAIGGLAAWAVSFIGIPMPPPPQATKGYLTTAMLNRDIIWEMVTVVFLSTLFSCFIPAYRVTHQHIIKALGYST